MNGSAYITPVVLALAAMALAAGPVGAQPKVTASVNETTVGTEERVVYTVTVDGGQLSQIETPQAPEAEGLTLVQRYPSTSRNISIVNGNMQQSVGFQWTYQPNGEGTARIGPARVTVAGKTYETEPITLTVVPQAQRPARGRRRDPFAGFLDPFADRDPEPPKEETPAPEDLFIRVVPSRRTAYQNEQLTVEYQLFFRDGIQLRQSRLTDSWDAEGFWREELDVDTRPIPRDVVEGGLRYHTIVLKRAAVFPTHAGELRIDPLRIETEAILPQRTRDPFESFFLRSRRYRPVEVASAPLTIRVKPLPPDAPPGFKGAVGQFRMVTRVDRTSLEVGESIQLKVVLSGDGNFATLEAPPFTAPNVFEQYEPEVASSIDRSGRRIRGTKTFTYVLVPRSHGTYELPPVTFSYFDPQAGRYRTLSSEPRVIHVTGTAETTPPVGATAAGLPVDDIAGLLTDGASWTRTARRPLHRNPWTYALLLLPALVLGGLMLYQRHTRRLATDVSYARNRRAHPMARKHLREAEALLRRNEPRAFYAEVERAVLGFVGNRLNIAETGLTRTQLDERLARAGIPAELREDLRRLLDECDRIRFAPILPDRAAMEAARDRAGRLIVAFDACLRQESPPVNV